MRACVARMGFMANTSISRAGMLTVVRAVVAQRFLERLLLLHAASSTTRLLQPEQRRRFGN